MEIRQSLLLSHVRGKIGYVDITHKYHATWHLSPLRWRLLSWKIHDQLQENYQSSVLPNRNSFRLGDARGFFASSRRISNQTCKFRGNRSQHGMVNTTNSTVYFYQCNWKRLCLLIGSRQFFIVEASDRTAAQKEILLRKWCYSNSTENIIMDGADRMAIHLVLELLITRVKPAFNIFKIRC